MKRIFEESWAYQEMMKKGVVKGEEKGKINTTRQHLLLLIQENFPALTPVVEKKIKRINKSDALEKAFKEMIHARSIEDAQKVLDALLQKK